MLRNLSTQAQIIGSNSVSALLFNDTQSAEKYSAGAQGMQPISCPSGLPADGRPPFASYSRDRGPHNLCFPNSSGQTETHWIENGQIAVVRSIVLDREADWAVYIPI